MWDNNMTSDAGVSQVVAVVAWKSLQNLLTWCGPFKYQILQTKDTTSFWLIHCSHGVLGGLNQASQHHFAQQAVGFSAELCYDLGNTGVTHTYRKTNATEMCSLIPDRRASRIRVSSHLGGFAAA